MFNRNSLLTKESLSDLFDKEAKKLIDEYFDFFIRTEVELNILPKIRKEIQDRLNVSFVQMADKLGFEFKVEFLTKKEN